MRTTDSKVQSGYGDQRFNNQGHGGMPVNYLPPGIHSSDSALQPMSESPAYPSAGHGVPDSYHGAPPADARQPPGQTASWEAGLQAPLSNQQFAGPHAQVQSQGVMPGMRRSQL